ncbi:hypothetical protein CsSME_00042043 [Camellia sinensis var. sinensis]
MREGEEELCVWIGNVYRETMNVWMQLTRVCYMYQQCVHEFIALRKIGGLDCLTNFSWDVPNDKRMHFSQRGLPGSTLSKQSLCFVSFSWYNFFFFFFFLFSSLVSRRV